MQMLKELFSLENKTAIVTGAAGGLGQQFALTLAEVGAHLILIDKQERQLENVHNQIQALGNGVQSFCIDLANPDDITTTMKQIHDQNPHIDILINNAGIGGGLSVESSSIDEALAHYQEYTAVNFQAPWLLSHLIVQGMIKHKIAGSIINISSGCGDRCPGKFNGIYSATKAALIQITRSMALELAQKKIRVNAILPGVINTPMAQDILNSENFDVEDIIPLGFVAVPEDLKALVLLLASNKASSYITGTTIAIDGGASISPLYRKSE